MEEEHANGRYNPGSRRRESSEAGNAVETEMRGDCAWVCHALVGGWSLAGLWSKKGKRRLVGYV